MFPRFPLGQENLREHALPVPVEHSTGAARGALLGQMQIAVALSERIGLKSPVKTQGWSTNETGRAIFPHPALRLVFR
jgi:hypothetical protein